MYERKFMVTVRTDRPVNDKELREIRHQAVAMLNGGPSRQRNPLVRTDGTSYGGGGFFTTAGRDTGDE